MGITIQSKSRSIVSNTSDGKHVRNTAETVTSEERAVADRIKKALGGKAGDLDVVDTDATGSVNSEPNPKHGTLVLREGFSNGCQYYVNKQADGNWLVTVEETFLNNSFASFILPRGDVKPKQIESLMDSARTLAYARSNQQSVLVQRAYSASLVKAGVEQHEVKADDTLSKIAKQNRIDVDAIQNLNPEVDPKKLKIGSKLLLPVYEVKEGEDLGDVAAKLGFVDPEFVGDLKRRGETQADIRTLVGDILMKKDPEFFRSFVASPWDRGDQKTFKVTFPVAYSGEGDQLPLDQSVLDRFERIAKTQYIVAEGENWVDLARDLGVNLSELRRTSKDGSLKPGTTLTVPMPPSK